MRKNSSNIFLNIHNYPDEIGIVSDMEKSALILNPKNQRKRERDKSISEVRTNYRYFGAVEFVLNRYKK